MQFSHVVLGGTFDHIHKGHEALLVKAFAVGEKVTLGLTSDLYVSRAKHTVLGIQSYQKRKRQLEAWLKKNGYMKRTTIVPLHDEFGPSVTQSDYDAIIVSQETEKVAIKINRERAKQRMPPLAMIVIPMVPAEDSVRISSTRIRSGEIDHDGKLILPFALRKTLAHPIGRLIPDGTPILSQDTCLVSVGDTTTDVLLSQGIVPALAIIDFQARRERFDWKKDLWDKLLHKRKILYFASGPGFINTCVMGQVEEWSKKPTQTLFVIDGEEDLLVLPAILYAPIGSIVYYGQPDHGIVEVAVTRETKDLVQKLLQQFTAF
jgi:pantetheine-phosphate adenylyltransferase